MRRVYRPPPRPSRQVCCDLTRHSGVIHDERGVRAHRSAFGQRRHAGEQPRCQGRPVDGARLRLGDCLLDRVVGDVLGECRVGGDRRARQDRASRPSPRWRAAARAAAGTSSTLMGASIRSSGHRTRQLGLADGDDRDAAGLGVLERERHRGSPLVRHTRPRGRQASSSRSDETSSVGGPGEPGMPSAPRCTPPIPPVANTRMPAAWAAIIVAETVVAAQPPAASAVARLGRGRLPDRSNGAQSPAPPGRAPRVRRAVARRGSRRSPGRPRFSDGCASDAVATSRFCG